MNKCCNSDNIKFMIGFHGPEENTSFSMSSIVWIKNGRVIDPANKRDEVGDLYVRDGIIVDSLNKADQKENHYQEF